MTMLWARNNASGAVMGFSATTGFLQPFGLLQSIPRIGAKNVAAGMARWVGDASRLENSLAWIQDKSVFMRNRSATFTRELKEINRVQQGKWKATQVFDQSVFFLMQKMQLVADVPTWIGAYEKAQSEASAKAKAEGRAGPDVLDEIEDYAVAQADRAVIESQGAGEIKDLAGVQRDKPMLTMFFSYFSATWQLTVEATARTDFKRPAAVAGWVADMVLLNVIPAIGPALLMYLLKGGDDDPEELAKEAIMSQVGYALNLIPIVRELSGLATGFEYSGPAITMGITALDRAADQTLPVIKAWWNDGLDAAMDEVDEAFVKSYIRVLGFLFGLPATQALRSWNGWKAWQDGEEGAGPQSIIFGPPPK